MKNKKRWPDKEPYCERAMFGKPLTHFCPTHQYTAKKAGKCPTCREPLKSAGLTGRPPKKGSKKWKAFLKMKDFHPKGCR